MRKIELEDLVPSTVTLVLVGLLAALPAAAQPDWSTVEIETVEVRGGIYMLVGYGGNIGVSVGDDGVFLVDDQFAPLTEKVRAAVKKLGEGEIRFVVNTHWHFDHTGGNEDHGEAGALIVAHHNVRRRMSTEQFIEALGMEFQPSPEAALPVVTYGDSVTLHLNGEEIHAYHVPPAHTDGDSVVHFKNADVVHAGDLFFNGSYPFIDVSSGGSVDGMISAVEGLLEKVGDDTKIIPGHGPLATKQDLATYLEVVKGVRAAVAALVEAGKSIDEAVAAKPTAEWDEKWGQGFIQPDAMVKIVYTSLKQ